MPMFRKRPVVVEAWQWHGDPLRDGDPDWVAEATEPVVVVGLHRMATTGMNIHTREGTMRARPGDWIIKGVAGEVYPCGADIFAATYEEVTP